MSHELYNCAMAPGVACSCDLRTRYKKLQVPYLVFEFVRRIALRFEKTDKLPATFTCSNKFSLLDGVCHGSVDFSVFLVDAEFTETSVTVIQ